jgi:hypothetical protein
VPVMSNSVAMRLLSGSRRRRGHVHVEDFEHTLVDRETTRDELLKLRLRDFHRAWAENRHTTPQQHCHGRQAAQDKSLIHREDSRQAPCRHRH